MAELRLLRSLYREMQADLSRPHPFAAERVGMAFGKLGNLAGGEPLVLLTRYRPLPDTQYVDDDRVGACINGDAIRETMQEVVIGRSQRLGAFHVHLHDHAGETGLSHTDRRGIPPVIKSFVGVGRDAAHGILVFSRNHGSAWIWLPEEQEPVRASRVVVVGAPLAVYEATRQ